MCIDDIHLQKMTNLKIQVRFIHQVLNHSHVHIHQEPLNYIKNKCIIQISNIFILIFLFK